MLQSAQSGAVAMRSLRIEVCYRFFLDLMTLIHSTTDSHEIMEVIVWKVTQTLQAKGAVLWILGEAGRLEPWVACGLSEEYIEDVPVISKKTPLEPNGKNKDIFIDINAAEAPSITYMEASSRDGIRTILDLPITLKDGMIGLIRVFFTKKITFCSDEIEFLVAIARQCACAIKMARVCEEHQTRYDKLAFQTEKLSALGRMVAGVAHEINNPLTGILLYSTNLRKKVHEDGPLKEGLDIIVRATKRCRAIIQDLLECSREKPPWRFETDINNIIEESLCLLEHVFIINNIQIEKDLLPDIPKCFVDKDKIEQAFLNLLLNAVEAIGEEGVIRIRSSLSYDGKSIICEVEDTGCGISPDDMPRIFDPFFSTKPKGTGLGLSVTYAVLKNHQGDLKAFSRIGEGTRMVMEIPIGSNDLSNCDSKG
jgi:two-component system, NtrC family, sensor kinase